MHPLPEPPWGGRVGFSVSPSFPLIRTTSVSPGECPARAPWRLGGICTGVRLIRLHHNLDTGPGCAQGRATSHSGRREDGLLLLAAPDPPVSETGN